MKGECLQVEGVYGDNDGEGNEDVVPKYTFALFVTKQLFQGVRNTQ